MSPVSIHFALSQQHCTLHLNFLNAAQSRHNALFVQEGVGAADAPTKV